MVCAREWVTWTAPRPFITFCYDEGHVNTHSQHHMSARTHMGCLPAHIHQQAHAQGHLRPMLTRALLPAPALWLAALGRRRGPGQPFTPRLPARCCPRPHCGSRRWTGAAWPEAWSKQAWPALHTTLTGTRRWTGAAWPEA